MGQFTNQERIASVEREIKLRERVYPRLITSGRMTPDKASREIAVMKDVLAVLLGLDAAERLI